MTVAIAIDPNVRIAGNQTLTGFAEVQGKTSPDALYVGQNVVVRELESGCAGKGQITGIDPEKQLIFLAVDWPSLRREPSFVK